MSYIITDDREEASIVGGPYDTEEAAIAAAKHRATLAFTPADCTITIWRKIGRTRTRTEIIVDIDREDKS